MPSFEENSDGTFSRWRFDVYFAHAKVEKRPTILKFDPLNHAVYTFRWNRPYKHVNDYNLLVLYVVLYVFHVYFWNTCTLKSVNFEVVKLSRFGGKQNFSLTSTGLIINGVVWVKNLYLVPNKSQTISFWILEAVLFWKTICLGVQSHPEDQGDFGQCLTVNISECNNLLELSVYMYI